MDKIEKRLNILIELSLMQTTLLSVLMIAINSKETREGGGAIINSIEEIKKKYHELELNYE